MAMTSSPQQEFDEWFNIEHGIEAPELESDLEIPVYESMDDEPED